MPKTVEQLRTKYQVLSNMWLLANLRQPGRGTLQGPGRTHVAIVVGRAFEREELCF